MFSGEIRAGPEAVPRRADHRRRTGASGAAALWLATLLAAIWLTPVSGATPPETTRDSAAESGADTRSDPPTAGPRQALDIAEFQIEGVRLLSQEEVEEAVYPFMGPDRTADDVDKAREALEKAYSARGYQTVTVNVPAQDASGGIVVLRVAEISVGRLRVRGSRYFSLDGIKDEAPSLAEGTVPNFDAVGRDIATLNQLPDRRVVPVLRPGAAPGTVDVDLNVEDTLPLHGSLELNNRYSANTSNLRLNASLHYDNLWQLGHSISLGYQVAPRRSNDAEVYSASYLARLPGLPWLALLAYGTVNNSNVATLGGTNVVGKGEVVGGRAVATLPAAASFFHTLSAGVDYKNFDEQVGLNGSQNSTPVTYYPVSATYTAALQEESAATQLTAGLTFGTRGIGSKPEEFDAKRFKASPSFMYFRGELSRTQELPAGAQAAGKMQAQFASGPLISSEQFSAGGADSVRGYLESEVLADNGVLGSLELRSPALRLADIELDEWRIYAFAEGGRLSLNAPLPQQRSQFDLASVGIGSRIRLLSHVNGSLDFGVPLTSQSTTRSREPRIGFRAWNSF